MNIRKREGYTESYNPHKVSNAVKKAFEEVGNELPDVYFTEFAKHIEVIFSKIDSPTVEDIQDTIEDELIKAGHLKEAKAFIKYRQERTNVRKKGWQLGDLQKAIWENKYRYDSETFDQWIERVSGGNHKIAKLIRQKKFIFAGRILAHRGLGEKGKKVTLSNCYVMTPPRDNIESIFDTSKELARTYSAGGGCGVDISQLRPKGMAVNNSARSTSGAVSFMTLYDQTTGLIGQNGRRGALMQSILVSHPDIEDFINVKAEQGSITKSNISIRITDEFMNAVVNNLPFKLRWGDSEGRYMERMVDARELYMKNVQNNWDWAEAGFLFWDTIENNHMMNHHPLHHFAGVNPCAEEPLMADGSCLLGSINIAEYVVHPFTSQAYFDYVKFAEAVRTAVIGLNEVLDEGMDLHPLQGQRDNARDWRQIGLGIMGLSDMFIKMGIRYGSQESLDLSKQIRQVWTNNAIKQSALLAKEQGTFPMYDEDALFKSEWFNLNTTFETRQLVRQYGLRNSQLLTIAPTGSISTMWEISGGIEPIFATHYKRKTESIHGVDKYYDVLTPIIAQIVELTGENKIPDYAVTSHEIHWRDRINMQSVWQTGIDASISSTVNLAKETTVEECGELFILAWQKGLKGITIFRDGCKRAGILTLDDDDAGEPEKPVENAYVEDTKFQICPECGEKIDIIQNGCSICSNCGYSPCN